MAARNWAKTAYFGTGLAVGVVTGLNGVQRYRRSRHRISEAATPHGQTIVILGAGFGGVHVAEELAKLLPRKNENKIILVDQNNFLLFTPMLTEVAGGQLDARDVVSPVRHLSSRVQFQQGQVDAIDLAARTVTVTAGDAEDGVPKSSRVLQADQLVIALGSVTNFHGLPGVKEHSLTIKTLGDAAAICNRALALLERARAEPEDTERRALLTVVVAGGGFSGVETMAAVNDLLRDGARRYPNLHPADIRAVLVHPGKRLLPELTEQLASYAQHELEKRGVEVKLNSEISGAGEGYVEIKNRSRIPTRLLIWAAGVMPNPAIDHLDCKRGRHGGIVVDGCCAVPERPGVWALGDCAEISQPDRAGSYAPTAQNAMREGTHTARNIVACLSGKAPKPFVYKPVGELALVGKRAGVARVYGRSISGPLAWFLWRMIYLVKMPGLSKRIRIGIDWSLDVIFGREALTVPLERSSAE